MSFLQSLKSKPNERQGANKSVKKHRNSLTVIDKKRQSEIISYVESELEGLEETDQKRKSFFNSRAISFRRAQGTRGASVEALRGNTGAVFEGYARVERCSNYMELCGCKAGTEGTSKKPLFLLIKGKSLFVFKNEDAPSPMYAVDLTGKKSEIQPESHGLTDIHLESSLGDVEYRFIFDTNQDKKVTQFFSTAIATASDEGNVECVKEELGHEKNLRSSVVYANKIAAEKEMDQPECSPAQAPPNIVAALPY